jgi:zinc protease
MNWKMPSARSSAASRCRLRNPQALLQNIVTQKLYDLPADYWDSYPQKVGAVTAADVQRVAQKYVDMDHMQIVAVGDASY